MNATAATSRLSLRRCPHRWPHVHPLRRVHVHVHTQVLEFWAKHHSTFPTWAKAAQIVFALSPNSASSERVFSLLKQFFGEQQDSVLSDMIEVAIMLAYNERKVG